MDKHPGKLFYQLTRLFPGDDLPGRRAPAAKVYADPLLGVLRGELLKRIDEGRAAHVLVEHDYTIQLTGSDTSVVIDRYRNHQVLIDPVTKKPTEPDPNTLIVDAFTLRLVAGRWLVNDQRRIE